MKKRISAIFAVMLFIFGGVVSRSHAFWPYGPGEGMKEERMEGKMGKKGGMMEKRFKKLCDEINITEEQREKLKKHRERHMEKNKELSKKEKELRIALKEELDKEKTDNGKIGNITSDLKKISSERIDLRVEAILEMKKILTPEQFKELENKHRNKMKRMKDKMKDKNKGMKKGGRMDEDE